jgi:hypothetical protein
MSEPSRSSPPRPDAAERISARIADLRGFIQRTIERVPLRVRTALRRAVPVAFFIAIGFVLYRQLSDTDWPEVLRSVPRSPWFYIIFLLRYLNVPIADALSYSAVWARNLFRYFGVFLMKRMINTSFSAGSGDVYFLVWAVRTLRVTYRQAFSAGKDVTLLSAAAANAVAVLVLGAYLAFGDLSLMQSVRPEVLGLIIGVTLVTALLSLLVVRFRGKVLGISASVMWRVLGYHAARNIARLLLLGLQWTVGLPGSSLRDWISLLIVDLLVSRTPLIPGRGFLFLSLALGLASTIDAPEAQVTALFLTDTALMQVGAVASLIAGIVWKSKPDPLSKAPDNEGEPCDDGNGTCDGSGDCV